MVMRLLTYMHLITISWPHKKIITGVDFDIKQKYFVPITLEKD